MLATLLCVCAALGQPQATEMPWVVVAKDKKSFALEPTGKLFSPWGFNYDHDTEGRLIEDYWDKEWEKVEAHFGQMKKLGANVVRIHLQVGRFMESAVKPNQKSLDRLTKLLALWGPGVDWPFVQNVWFWAIAGFKFFVWLMILAVLWLTLWARQLRKLDRQGTK